MEKLSKYWHIWQINSASDRDGYQVSIVPLAQAFVQKEFACEQGKKTDFSIEHHTIQSVLFSYFKAKNLSIEPSQHAQAGLCLRCYISELILKACKKLAYLFGNQNQFTYRDLLPFVLNDDGKTLIFIAEDGKTQLIWNDRGEANITNYPFFSVKVLQTYQPNVRPKVSLDNWVYLQAKQNSEIKHFLSEFGFQHLSDWALLNRVKLKQKEMLCERDRYLLEVFHAVYRRDRRQQKQRFGKCPEPSNAQLQEMQLFLQARNMAMDNSVELLALLKKLALQLRQYDVWACREPLEFYYSDTQTYTTRSDLPSEYLNILEIERQELILFIEHQSTQALEIAIAQGIENRLFTLEKSKNYAPFAQKLLLGLQMYYCQGLSLRETVPQLGFTNWDRARRVLNPGELLNQVRSLYIHHLLNKMLERAVKMGLTQIPSQPDYLQQLIEQIEAFADAEIFTEAAVEIKAGKHRSLQSLYAQQIRRYLTQNAKTIYLNQRG
ncbi:MAG: hypothetical protein ACRC2R_09935 [Xenococcaceae cyanobacterium]